MIHSPSLADEMRSFVEDSETGKLGASEGCFDDRVMAHAMALQAMPHLWNDSEPLEIVDQPRRPPTAEEIEAAPFTLEAIMERIHAKHEIGYGLPSSRARHFLM